MFHALGMGVGVADEDSSHNLGWQPLDSGQQAFWNVLDGAKTVAASDVWKYFREDSAGLGQG